VSAQAGATAVTGNLTALPFSNGNLTIYASGQPKPNVSNLNYSTGLNVANSVTTLLSAGGAVDSFSNVGSCNLILDVTGYIV
jgi:hypothetical protein